MNVVEVEEVAKSFQIPTTRRDTLREHFSAFFWPRQYEELSVLDGISFHLQQGEALGIMGRNGSGKSTLLKILAGIYAPDRGRVEVRAAVTPILELGVGWNAQLTARDNIFLTGTALGMTRREIHQQLDEIIAFAELQRFVDLKLKHYSSGMSARLAYAIAFQAVRDLVLLDEIFAVGDAEFVERCRARYRDLHASGRSLILVSHQPEVIAKFCQRALLIENGRIVSEGSPREVADAYLKLLHVEPQPGVS